MTRSDIAQARRFCENMKGLMMDASGGLGYRPYADKVLYDITGLDKVGTKILASKNPYLAANRFSSHPISKNLARIFWDEDCSKALQALNDLVVCAYQAAQISTKPRKSITRDDQRAWEYLRKLYSNGIRTIRENYGYDQSSKNRFKEQFADLRDYSKGRGGYGGSLLPIFDDDEDEEDSDLFETDPNLAIRGIRKPTPIVPADDDALFGLDLNGDDDEDDDGDEDDSLPLDPRKAAAMARILRLQDDLRENPTYSPEKVRNVDYDFTGKATLETIADRMESLLEGIELIVSRMYGREMTELTPHPEAGEEPESDDEEGFIQPPAEVKPSEEPAKVVMPEQFFQRMLAGDFSMLTTTECIKIYNSLSDQLTALANDRVQYDAGHIKPVGDSSDDAVEDEVVPGMQQPLMVEVGGDPGEPEELETPTESTAQEPDSEVSAEPSAADLFNSDQAARQAETREDPSGDSEEQA